MLKLLQNFCFLFLKFLRLKHLSILAGTNSLSNGGERRDVIASLPHKKYNNKLNDIALMKLAEALPLTESIRSIDIATEEISPGSPIIIAGWGKSSTFGSVTNRLKVNTLRAMSSRSCAYSLGINYKGLICLGHSRHNGACYVSSYEVSGCK